MALFVPKDRRSLFRQFLGGMYDAVVIADPNGHIIDLNARAVEYLGYELEEALDQPISLFVPGLKAEVVQRIRKGLEGDRHVLIDANARTKAGEKIACEIAVSVIDLMNPGDLIFTIRNVERRRAVMAALRGKAAAFEHAQSALFVCESDGRICSVNAAFRALFGLAPEEAIEGRVFSDFMPDAPLVENFKKALAGETTTLALVVEEDSAVKSELEVVLAPHQHGAKIQGVVGSIVKAS